MVRAFDEPWKIGLDRFFRPLLRILCPHLHAAIDWSISPVCLDAELQQIVRDGEFGPTQGDRLFKVKLLNGQETFILIHLEIQAQYDVLFPERMFRYACRIRDRYQTSVASLAFLIDDSPTWRPHQYVEESLTSKTVFDFLAVKLLDWRDKLEELESDESPIGLMLIATLQSHFTQGDEESRRRWKFRLLRSLLQRDLTPELIREFSRLVDWLLNLKPENDATLLHELYAIEEKEKAVELIGSLEELIQQRWEAVAKEKAEAIGQERGMAIGQERGIAIGRQEGRQEGVVIGRQEGLGQGLLLALELRFGAEGLLLGQELQRKPPEEWATKLETALRKAATIEELRAAMG